jgi:hypothetical protein
MDPQQIRSGDWVEFFDTDQTRWGPWRVRRVEGRNARVEVDGFVEDLIPLERLRKIPSDHSQ